MSLAGKDFDEAMKQLNATLIDARITIINVNNLTLKLNLILDKLNVIFQVPTEK